MTELAPHIKVVQHPNPKRRSFHVVREVYPNRDMYGFGKEDSLYLSFEKRQDPGEIAKELAKKLEAIPGVTDGHFRQYEIAVGIGDAFSWKDVGPLVLGEIIKVVYPDVVDGTIEVSTQIGWSYYARPNSFGLMGGEDDGFRSHYQDMVDRQPVEVNFGAGRPMLNIEHLLGSEALQEAKAKKAAETVYED